MIKTIWIENDKKEQVPVQVSNKDNIAIVGIETRGVLDWETGKVLHGTETAWQEWGLCPEKVITSCKAFDFKSKTKRHHTENRRRKI